MSILEKVYCKFANLEEAYSASSCKKSRKEFITDLFGGNVDEGAAILTEAIICENPSTTEELEHFSFVKDLFNFFIKNINDLDDRVASFDDILNDISSENDAFGNLEMIMDSISKVKRPVNTYECISQQEMYNACSALHYSITPDSVHFVTLDNCVLHKILSKAHAEICVRMYNSDKKLTIGSTYQKRKTDFTKINKNEIPKILGMD